MTPTKLKPLKILLAAVEPSGDSLGAALYRQLKNKTPEGTEFFGCGGLLMEQEGFHSAFPTDAFAIIGLTGFLKAIPEGLKRAKEIGQLAAVNGIDAAVFIDGWAFSWRSARYTKMYSPKTLTVKYAAPQVWASRPGRVHTAKQHFDSVLTLLPFEPPYFQGIGMKAEFVGNPNFQSVYNQAVDKNAFIERYGLTGQKILVVLPGSRKSEVSYLAKPFGETIETLTDQIDNLRVIIPPAPVVSNLVKELFAPYSDKITYIEPNERFAAFHIADAALAASGTVSTELAITGTPMIVAYKLDPLTYFWARSVATTEYVSILNNAAQKEIIPELLQDDCTPELLVPAVRDLLMDEDKQNLQRSAFTKLLDDLAINEAPAAERAAEAVLDLLRSAEQISV